jgi:copper chaperone NosL
MVLGLVALACIFFFPIWQITLKATQFPEGLELYIFIDELSGNSESILQQVNRLNHYIGMKAIEPDSIPELKYFPYIIYGMLGLGVIAILIDRAWSYLSWSILLAVLGLLGVYDFYLWIYDYGHDLDPSAPITIEGGSFMPPLFGGKEMANFDVTSYPDWGSATIGLAILLGAVAFWSKKRTAS